MTKLQWRPHLQRKFPLVQWWQLPIQRSSLRWLDLPQFHRGDSEQSKFSKDQPTICQVSCSGCSWCCSPPETSACTRPSACVGPSPPSSLTADPWQLWNHKIWHFRSWKFSKLGLLCLCAPQLYLWCEPPWGQSQKETALPSPPSIRSALRRNYFNHQLNGIEGERERERERGRRSVGLDIAKKL